MKVRQIASPYRGRTVPESLPGYDRPVALSGEERVLRLRHLQLEQMSRGADPPFESGARLGLGPTEHNRAIVDLRLVSSSLEALELRGRFIITGSQLHFTVVGGCTSRR